MIIDARDVPGGTVLPADVCIVGAGPAGISMARALARVDVRVLVLESGGREPDAFAAALNRGESVGRSYFRLDLARVRAFGGTSTHWHDDGYRSRPLDEIDFEPRPELPHSGWPLDRADLDPWYEQAHVASRLSSIPYDNETWAAPLDPDVAAASNGRLRPALFRIGAGPPRFFSSQLAELEQEERATVVLHATVTDLALDEHRRSVRAVSVRTPGGNGFTVTGGLFVLAAGGIENPRLLLLNEHQRRGGLGNEHDNVGRFFMEHLHLAAGVLVLSDPTWRTRLPSDDVVRSDVRYRQTVTLDPRVLRSEGLGNTAFYFASVVSADAGRGLQSLRLLREARRSSPRPPGVPALVGNVIRSAPALLGHGYRRSLHRPPVPLDVLQVTAIGEQSPNPDSRVVLGRGRDAFGRSVARLDWRTTELDLASVRRSFDILEEALVAAGAGTFSNRHADLFDDVQADDLFAPRPMVGEYHHMGTTRMHDDPKQGVVDRDGRVHGTENLYVAGSSVFPTSGHANPTLTVVALGLRLADHIRRVVAAAPLVVDTRPAGPVDETPAG